MKKIIRKITALLALIGILAALPACGETPTATPTAAPEATPAPIVGVDPKTLGDYTVVYPDEYKDWQMEEVKLLQTAIKHVSGKDVNAVKASEAETQKEIILASSNRNTFADSAVNALEGRLDYVINVSEDENKIVLGGKDYFGDMKAVYDFVNSYLGYDDIDGNHTAEVTPILGTLTSVYTEPAFTTMVYNPGKYPFPSVKETRDMAEAGFNMVELDLEKFTEDDRHDYLRWCTRFNIRIVIRAVYDTINNTFNTYDIDETANNPIIYGHLSRFTERHTDAYAVYKENYKKYGWKLIVKFENILLEELAEETTALFTEDDCFANADVLLVMGNLAGKSDYDRENLRYALKNSKYIADYAHKNGMEFWFSICENDGLTFGPEIYVLYENVFRYQGYMALTLGANGVAYGHYRRGQIVNDNYSRTALYDRAKQINNELIEIGEVKADYEYLGMVTISTKIVDEYLDVPNQYDGEFAGIKSYTPSNGYALPMAFGYYKAKDGSEKYAFVQVDASDLMKTAGAVPASRYEFGGTKITQYKNGEVSELKADDSGKYRISIKNGNGVFVTIE